MPLTEFDLQDVFVLSGVPTHTFVPPTEYTRLLVALKTPGRSIVIEGPSGIGKTTAVEKAVHDSGISNKVSSLTARKPQDIEYIKCLSELLPFGTVIIDDFHRLDIKTKKGIADLMKTLADEGTPGSKLIVIGISNAGKSLILFGKDLANRIEIIPFESNPSHKIDELLAKGEMALNIDINIREDIIADSHGSFYIAQMLAFNTCIKAGILKTVHTKLNTNESYELVKHQVVETLSRSFHDTAIAFSRGTKLRREGRAPYLHLLYWLSQSSNWQISIDREADRHPEQRGSVLQVATKGYLNILISASSDLQRVLHFDSNNNMLIAQDPQFIFYIRNLSWTSFAEEVGFVSIEFPSRYDFALSFAGSDRDIAEALFEGLQDCEVEVFYDKNEQHRILAEDVEEYLGPIYTSDAKFVICILGPDYPKRVWTKFESEQFKQRFSSGEVIPMVLSNAPLGVFDTAAKIGYLSWDRSMDFKKQCEATVETLIRKCGEVRLTQLVN